MSIEEDMESKAWQKIIPRRSMDNKLKEAQRLIALHDRYLVQINRRRMLQSIREHLKNDDSFIEIQVSHGDDGGLHASLQLQRHDAIAVIERIQETLDREINLAESQFK